MERLIEVLHTSTGFCEYQRIYNEPGLHEAISRAKTIKDSLDQTTDKPRVVLSVDERKNTIKIQYIDKESGTGLSSKEYSLINDNCYLVLVCDKDIVSGKQDCYLDVMSSDELKEFLLYRKREHKEYLEKLEDISASTRY